MRSSVTVICYTQSIPVLGQSLQLLPHQHYVDGEQLGVHYTPVPGYFRELDVPGTAHVFAKGMRSEAHLLVRGFIYFDEFSDAKLVVCSSMQRCVCTNPHHRQPSYMVLMDGCRPHPT